MQRIFLVLITSLGLVANAAAQDTLKYFVDYYNKKCPHHLGYFYRVQKREGHLWYIEDYYAREQVLQMTGRYTDDSLTKAEGVFYYYHKNSKLETVSRYKNGLREGLSMHYDSTGRVLDSTYYKNGQPSAFSFAWYPSGHLAKKGVYDLEGLGTGEEWFFHEGGTLADHGRRAAGFLPDSTWTFYYEDGGVNCIDVYERGEHKKRTCYDHDGKVKKGKCKDSAFDIEGNVFRTAMSILKDKRAAVDNCKDQVRDLKGALVLNVCTDITGRASVEIIQSYHHCPDSLLVDMIQNIQFQPAIIHNRPSKRCKIFAEKYE